MIGEIMAMISLFSFGVMVGGLIENYRARILWGFDLGTTWKPDGKAQQ